MRLARANDAGSLLSISPRADLSLRFFDRNGLAGCDVGEFVHLPARPVNLDGIGFGFRSQTEGQHQFAGRKIARARLHRKPLLLAPSADADDSADAVAVRFRADKFYSQALIGSALIQVEMRRAAVGRHEHVERPVIIDVSKSRAPRHFRSGKRTRGFVADFCRDFLELAVAGFTETKITK